MRAFRFCGLALAGALVFGVVGCSEKSEVQEQTKITTPGGESKITKDTKIESSGKNPPAPPEGKTPSP